jgi:predicted transposase YbfD/YdcC
VRAFSADFGLVLGAVRTPEKSNEIRAIPELLELLALEGTMVTIDAGGCYPAIAKKIVERGGDYIIALKGNQTHLHADTIALCTGPGCAQLTYDFAETKDVGHGREETRRAWVYRDVGSLRRAHDFEGLVAVIRVQSIRTVKGKETTEDRYYLTCREGITAAEALQFIRRHWAIENELHWILDVAFREDKCRILAANVAEAFSHVRAATIPLLRAAPGPKVGAETRRMMAAWDDNFLETVMLGMQGI